MPERLGGKIDISYTISGVNEKEVKFTVSYLPIACLLHHLTESFVSIGYSQVSQASSVIKSIENESAGEVSIRADKKDEMQVCW